MTTTTLGRPAQVLLVEDAPSDVRLMEEAIRESSWLVRLHVARDGAEATRFLMRQGTYADAPQPDLVLLDLNLPRKSGLDVLAEMRANERTQSTPVVILSVSQAVEDIVRCYSNCANCYITKPADLDRFMEVVKAIEDFWLAIVQLPPNPVT